MEDWEKKIWKEYKETDTLFDMLMKLSKDILLEIGNELKLKGLSNLRKADLVERLAEEIPCYFPVFMSALDSIRCRALRLTSMNEGKLEIPFGLIGDYDCAVLQELGMAYLGRIDNKKYLVIPKELAEVFQENDTRELSATIKRNDRILHSLTGLIYHCGAVDIEHASKFLYQFAEDDEDIMELMLFMKVTLLKSKGLKIFNGFIVAEWVEDPEYIIKEQKMRSDIDYKEFSLDELIKAGQYDYIDDNQYTRNIRKLARKYYDVKEDLLDDFIFNLLDIIRQDEPFAEGLHLVSGMLGIPEMEFIEQFSQVYMEIYNNTSKWILKGHTSIELRPDPSPVGKHTEKKGKVLEFKRKPGRNDPCPCGSGKKYKYCCGK